MDRDTVLQDSRFKGIVPFEKKVCLSSPTMHGEDFAFVKENEKTEKILPPVYGKDEKWVQEYMEQFGAEPSFF